MKSLETSKFYFPSLFPEMILRRQINFAVSAVQVFLLGIFYFSLHVTTASTGCSECKFFVETFKHGMKQTEKAHFGGGNTAWESEKLGKYSRSETRLVEILEYACKKTDDVSSEKDDEHKCQGLVEHHEETIENWYFHKQASDPDFFSWLCIDSLKACCPPNTFGANCDPCPGDIERPCFGNGKCDGAGTRIGSGKCKCDKGYQGNLCRKCAANYYASFQNDTHITCERCDVSCKSSCKHAGPSGCVECKSGWTMKEDVGCEDVDECQLPDSVCNLETETCKNTIGSYQCQCKDGYKKEHNECVLDVTAPRPTPIFLGLYADQLLRYCAISGLLVALIVIIYRRSLGLALGFLVTITLMLVIETDTVTQFLRNMTESYNVSSRTDEF